MFRGILHNCMNLFFTSYLFLFYIIFIIKLQKNLKKDLSLDFFYILIFGFRFFVEFLKVEQSPFEKGLLLDMGQLLSIPFVIAGLYFMFRKQKEAIKKKK